MKKYIVLLALPALLQVGCSDNRSAGAGQLNVGDPAPEFSLHGSNGSHYALNDLKRRKAFVIAWFPKAFSSG